jgi:hypothetical protein
MEGRIAKMVSDLVVNRDRLMAHMREKIEALRQDLRRDYPEAEAARIADKLDKIDRAKKNYRRQAAEELISFGELKEALVELEAERTALSTGLEKLRNREKHIKKLEGDQGVMLALFTGSLACGLEHLSLAPAKTSTGD